MPLGNLYDTPTIIIIRNFCELILLQVELILLQVIAFERIQEIRTLVKTHLVSHFKNLPVVGKTKIQGQASTTHMGLVPCVTFIHVGLAYMYMSMSQSCHPIPLASKHLRFRSRCGRKYTGWF